MKTLRFIILISILFVSKYSIAIDMPPNVVKMNIASLPLLNFSFQYERAFHKNMSGALGFSIMPKRGLPGAGSAKDVDVTGTLNNLKFSGMSVTPEFRYYPGTKKGAPNGFYIAPYMRYAQFKITTTTRIDYTDPSSGFVINDDFPLTGTFKGIGGGILCGSQWIIGEHFSIDWWILGMHYGGAKATFEIKNLPNLSTKDIEEAINEFEAIDTPFGKINATVTPTTAKLDWVTSYMGIRAAGLALGFAF